MMMIIEVPWRGRQAGRQADTDRQGHSVYRRRDTLTMSMTD